MKVSRKYLLISCLAFSCHLQAQIRNADTLIRRAFTALKNNDEKTFVALFPNYIQFRKIIDQGVENIQDTTMKKQFTKALTFFNKTSFDSGMTQNVISQFFKPIREQGNKKNIDWETAEFISADYKEETDHILKIKTLKGVISLKDNKEEFHLLFSDITWSVADEGWFGIKLEKMIIKGEKWDDPELAPGVKVEIEKVEVQKYDPPPPQPPMKEEKNRVKAKVKS